MNVQLAKGEQALVRGGRCASDILIRRSMFSVRCSMFKLLHLKFRPSFHNTLKIRTQVRSSKIILLIENIYHGATRKCTEF